MDIFDIIPTILDSLDKNACNNLSTIKNRYNTARKNKSFDLYRWVSGKNIIQVMNMISCSLGLIGTCDDDDVLIVPLARARKKDNAKSLMTVVLKFITDNSDFTSDEGMSTVNDISNITALSIFIFLNKSLYLDKFDAVLYSCCELIYDFFYGLFRWMRFKKNACSNYASEVFNALIRRNYYKNYITRPLKNYLKLQDCGCIENLTSGERTVLNKLISLPLTRSKRTALDSDQWYCYCNSYTGNYNIFDSFTSEEIKITNMMFSFFSEGLTYTKYKILIRKECSAFSFEKIMAVIAVLIEHNHLMFYTDKTKKEFMHILNCKGLLEGEYKNSERLFFSNTYYRPTCYQEAVEKTWLFQWHNTNREEQLIHTLLELWKCNVLLLTLNKDIKKEKYDYITETNLMIFIYKVLSFFDEPKVISEYIRFMGKKMNSSQLVICAALYKALLNSDAIVVSVRDSKKIITQEPPCKYDSEKTSPIVEETYKELIELLSKQRTCSFINSFVESKLEPLEADIVYERFDAMAAKDVVEYSRNKRNKHDIVTHVYRVFLFLLSDEYEYNNFYERLLRAGLLKPHN